MLKTKIKCKTSNFCTGKLIYQYKYGAKMAKVYSCAFGMDL